MGRPPLLLADEPTGNLDAGTTQELLVLLEQLHMDFGLTLMIATHDPMVAAKTDRIIRLARGRMLDGRETTS
jgi:putative ABC transport system ATP-binding protein